jgi:hypothetical protein
MKCPKCGYTSFPYLDNCGKCGQGLAKHRAAFGLYALRPDPPDLLMAYQAVQLDVDGTTLTPALPSPRIDLGHLDDIDLELADAEDTPSAAEVGQEQVEDAAALTPTIPPDPAPDLDLLRVESDTARATPLEEVIPPAFDLGEPADITLALEDTGDLGVTSLESPQIPTEAPEVKQVYELDLVEEDTDGLTLGSDVDNSHADESEEGTGEYILEIEDEFELEIDELTLEEGDESGEEDDDDR